MLYQYLAIVLNKESGDFAKKIKTIHSMVNGKATYLLQMTVSIRKKDFIVRDIRDSPQNFVKLKEKLVCQLVADHLQKPAASIQEVMKILGNFVTSRLGSLCLN